MSLSIGNVTVTIILSAVAAVAAFYFSRPQSQRNSGHSHNEASLCHICCRQFQTRENLKKLPCGHEFHEECINSVLGKQVRPSCPYCRKIFSPGEAAW